MTSKPHTLEHAAIPPRSRSAAPVALTGAAFSFTVRSIMTDWYIGQKVVYVDDRGHISLSEGERCPVRSSIYTIRDILENEEGVGFTLVELVNPVCRMRHGDLHELRFRTWRFRPLVDQSADIREFTAILDRINRQEADLLRIKELSDAGLFVEVECS
jgi:hypothetical protein